MHNCPSDTRVRLIQETLARLGLPTELGEDIERDLIWVTYQKGAYIFLPGQPAEVLFWLVNGFVKLYLPHNDGGRTLVGLRKPGEFVGFATETDSAGGYRQVFEAHALTKCSVAMLTRQNLTKLLDRIGHQFSTCLLEQLNAVWSIRFLRYATFVGSPFRTRLEMVFEDLGRGFGIDDERGTLLMLELSHEDLAEMIGCSRPMISKLIADLTQEGLLMRGENRRFIVIAKPPSSAQIANGKRGATSNSTDLNVTPPVKRSRSARITNGKSEATLNDAPLSVIPSVSVHSKISSG